MIDTPPMIFVAAEDITKGQIYELNMETGELRSVKCGGGE